MNRSEGDINLTPGRAEWLAGHVGPETRGVLDRDDAAFLHQALSTPCLNVVERAEGVWLTDAEGRRFMDFHGNSVHQVGWGQPRVIAAITQQMATLPFSPRRYANRVAIALAERLGALAPARPQGGLTKVLFAPGGTSAIGMALKLARAATGRHKTVSMWDAFHGASLDAISVGGEAIFRRDAGPLLPGTEHVPPPALAARFFGDDGRAHERLADYIDYVLDVQGDVAAVVAEPVRWTTIEAPPADFWPRVRASCDRHGVLLIFDEIPSCLGRTGTMFACEQSGCAPDMLVLGKGLGGGIIPIAALLARADLDVMGNGALGHYTHEKSPVGCAAAMATLDVIEQEALLPRSRALGAAAVARLAAIAHPAMRGARGLGLSMAVDVADETVADRLLYACLERGLSFKIGAGTVLVLCPPLTITESEIDQALGIVEAAFASV